MRAGREASPWLFVPLGLAALRMMPGDEEVRLLLAGAYARLGLRTAALEQLERLSAAGGVRGGIGAQALADAARSMGADRVGMDELQRTLLANIEALRQRSDHALDLRSRIESWRARASTREHFRAQTGDIVWRVPGDATAWQRLDSQAEQASGVRLPHEGESDVRVMPPWYIVEGMDPPWILRRVCEATGGRYDGYTPRVIVVQLDVEQFVDGLAQADISAQLADPRVVLFVGADAGTRLDEFLRGRAMAGVRVASVTIGLPTTERRLAMPAQQVVDRVAAEAVVETGLARAGVDRMYAGRDRAWWAGRFAGALAGTAAPLRVLVTTSRYSTFLRHSAADLAEALRACGCAVDVLMEPDGHSVTEALAYLRAVEAQEPDLIVLPNYLRRDVAAGLPANVPFVSWIQDAMPGLFDRAAGESVGPLDFIAGNLREDLFQTFGYPRGRAMHAPMAASSRKFHNGPVDSAAAPRFACEIAYVSHHSEAPEALHAARCAEGRGSPALVRTMEALLPQVLAIVDEPITTGPKTLRLHEATLDAMRAAGVTSDERTATALLNTYTLQIADRAMRHQTLAWAANLASRRGWRMHLYGRGWDKHPTLASCARGELDHGEDLRACYQTARTHLHVSLHTAIHQRVFECALSGGLPVCRLQADDLSHLEYLAGAHACRVGEAVVSDLRRKARFGHRIEGYAIDSCEQTRRYVNFVRNIGLDAPEFVWLTSIHADRLRAAADETIDGDGRSIWDLWPDPAALMFHDEASMERVLVKGVENEPWRQAQSDALRRRAMERVTYDSLAGSLLKFVAVGLAVRDADRGRRWYDPERPSAGCKA